MPQNNDLTLRVGFDIDKFSKDLSKSTAALNNFSGQVQNAAKGLLAFMSVRAVTDFTVQISRLAGEAEGVKAAFSRLPESVSLMRDLKDATGGTVSELELMKRSVMASNFDISLQELPRLLEFATLRARQTGQSVDYLVDSIVTGIGRKSKLILDNLGISAVRLTDALGGASAASSSIAQVSSAVGKIIDEELPKMGKLTDDAAVKADRLNASWQNFKVTLGRGINAAGGSVLLDEASKMLDQLQKNLEESSRSGRWLTPMITSIEDLHEEIDKLNNSSKNGFFKADNADQVKYIADAAKRLGVEIKMITDESTQGTKIIYDFQVGMRKWVDASKDVPKITRNVAYLEEQIKLLNEEIKLSDSPTQIEKYKNDIVDLEHELDNLMGKYKSTMNAQAQFDAWMTKLGESTKTVIPSNVPIAGITPADKAMKNAQISLNTQKLDADAEHMAEVNEKLQQDAERTAASYARIGDAVGESFGNMITGAETFAQAMGKMAVSVINQLERIAIAKMIAASANPLTIAFAAAGFGIIKSLFARIGSDGGGGSAAPVAARSNPSRTTGGGYHMVEFKLKGKDVVGMLKAQNIYDSRVKTVS